MGTNNDNWKNLRISSALDADEVIEFYSEPYHYTLLDKQKCSSTLITDRAERQHFLYLMENAEGRQWWLVIKPSLYFIDGKLTLCFPENKDRLVQEKIWPASPVYIPYLKKRFGFTNFDIQNL